MINQCRIVQSKIRLLVVLVTILIGTVIFPSSGMAILKGDLLDTGTVTVSDALTALRFAVGLAGQPNAYDLSVGDLTGTGSITVADALLILREVVGLGPTLSGTASQGAAIPEGTVVLLTDTNGVTYSTTVGTNGSYTAQVTGLTAPYVLQTSGFYSFASTTGITNINPLTNFSMQVALGTSSITGSTPLPANFPTQYASVVSNLETGINGLYPVSVTSTQRDFQSGTLSIGVGADVVFGALTISPPSAPGTFSASVDSQQIFSGTIVGSIVTIMPNPTAIASTSTILFPSTPATPALVSIAVTPANPSIAIGATQQFKATGTYSDNSTQDLTSRVIWSSSQTSVSTMATSGLATAVASGVTTITATYGSVSRTAALTVQAAPPKLVSIALTPANTSIAIGATQQFKATGTYSDNSTQDLTSTVTWGSSNTAVATITTSGNATIVAVGSVTITATSGSISGTATLTSSTGAVSISGQVTSNGTGLSGVTVTLTGSGSTTVQTGSNGTFLFSGASNGTYTVSAALNGYTVSSAQTVTVNGANVSGINFTATVVPATYSISGRVTNNGTGLSGVTVTLSRSGSSSTQTDSNGNFVFTGATNGTYSVSASATGYGLSSAQLITVNSTNISGLTFTAVEMVITIAGGGSTLGDGGLATSASVFPGAISFDQSGNIIFADAGNNRIRKIVTSTGVISTIAGNGTAAFAGDGSAATSASLNNPNGLALDNSGNIYIADSGNQRIRVISATTSVISTIAGNGVAAFAGDGSAATSASLNNPYSVALDGSGNIYIADASNNRIRMVSATTGVITTVAGNGLKTFAGDGGAATSASLWSPSGIACDRAGNYYIADSTNDRIRKVTIATGIISTIAGANSYGGYAGDGGLATAASLYNPMGIAFDASNNIFFADNLNNCVRRIDDITGIITTIANLGQGLNASPVGVTFDNSGNMFITTNLWKGGYIAELPK